MRAVTFFYLGVALATAALLAPYVIALHRAARSLPL